MAFFELTRVKVRSVVQSHGPGFSAHSSVWALPHGPLSKSYATLTSTTLSLSHLFFICRDSQITVISMERQRRGGRFQKFFAEEWARKQSEASNSTVNTEKAWTDIVWETAVEAALKPFREDRRASAGLAGATNMVSARTLENPAKDRFEDQLSTADDPAGGDRHTGEPIELSADWSRMVRDKFGEQRPDLADFFVSTGGKDTAIEEGESTMDTARDIDTLTFGIEEPRLAQTTNQDPGCISAGENDDIMVTGTREAENTEPDAFGTTNKNKKNKKKSKKKKRDKDEATTAASAVLSELSNAGDTSTMSRQRTDSQPTLESAQRFASPVEFAQRAFGSTVGLLVGDEDRPHFLRCLALHSAAEGVMPEREIATEKNKALLSLSDEGRKTTLRVLKTFQDWKGSQFKTEESRMSEQCIASSSHPRPRMDDEGRQSLRRGYALLSSHAFSNADFEHVVRLEEMRNAGADPGTSPEDFEQMQKEEYYRISSEGRSALTSIYESMGIKVSTESAVTVPHGSADDH